MYIDWQMVMWLAAGTLTSGWFLATQYGKEEMIKVDDIVFAILIVVMGWFALGVASAMVLATIWERPLFVKKKREVGTRDHANIAVWLTRDEMINQIDKHDRKVFEATPANNWTSEELLAKIHQLQIYADVDVHIKGSHNG